MKSRVAVHGESCEKMDICDFIGRGDTIIEGINFARFDELTAATYFSDYNDH